MGKVKKKKDLPIDVIWEALNAKDSQPRRYNSGNVLHDYWNHNKSKLNGWSFNKFYNYLQGLNRTEVELEYKDAHRKFGDFSQWI